MLTRVIIRPVWNHSTYDACVILYEIILPSSRRFEWRQTRPDDCDAIEVGVCLGAARCSGQSWVGGFGVCVCVCVCVSVCTYKCILSRFVGFKTRSIAGPLAGLTSVCRSQFLSPFFMSVFSHMCSPLATQRASVRDGGGRGPRIGLVKGQI